MSLRRGICVAVGLAALAGAAGMVLAQRGGGFGGGGGRGASRTGWKREVQGQRMGPDGLLYTIPGPGRWRLAGLPRDAGLEKMRTALRAMCSRLCGCITRRRGTAIRG